MDIDSEVALELSAWIREAERRAHEKLASQQFGLAFMEDGDEGSIDRLVWFRAADRHV